MLTDLFRNPDDQEDVVDLSSNGESPAHGDSPAEDSPKDPPDRGSSEGGAAETASEDPPMNPYLEQTRHFRNVRQRLRREKLVYMILAALTTLGLIVAVAVNLWLSTASRVEPFYVAVDETEGEVVDARPVRQGQSLSEPLIQSQIRTVIRGLRVVYADPRATKRGYEEAFRKILPSSEAESFIRQRYLPEDTEREDPTSPPALVGRVQRTITDLEVTPIEGTRSYNIRWIERELSQSSNTVTERAFSGSASTVRLEESNLEALRQNPLGLYIDGLSWQQTSEEILRSTDEPAPGSGPSANTSSSDGRSSSSNRSPSLPRQGSPDT